MNEEKSVELLPCPFCRRKPKVSKDGGPGTMRQTEWHITCNGAGYPGPYHKVHVYVSGQSREAAITAWNTRSTTPPAEDAVEAVAAVVKLGADLVTEANLRSLALLDGRPSAKREFAAQELQAFRDRIAILTNRARSALTQQEETNVYRS